MSMTSRQMQDAALSQSVALPYAANTANTNYIDLGAVLPFPITESVGLHLAATIATQTNSKNINVRIQDCADTNASNFTNITLMPAMVITGNTTNVVPTTFDTVLPPSVKRYIKASATGEANGGNSADGTLTVQLMF